MNTVLRRRYPRKADRVVFAATNALALSVNGNAKKLADAAGVSDRLARDWLAGNPSSVVARFFELVVSIGQGAAVLVATAKILLMQALLSMDADKLVRDFWKAMDDETRRQGEADIRQVGAIRTLDDLRALQAALTAQATEVERLAAITAELIEQEIVPSRDA